MLASGDISHLRRSLWFRLIRLDAMIDTKPQRGSALKTSDRGGALTLEMCWVKLQRKQTSRKSLDCPPAEK